MSYINNYTSSTDFNELCMAQAITGREGRTVEALNLKNVKEMTQ